MDESPEPQSSEPQLYSNPLLPPVPSEGVNSKEYRMAFFNQPVTWSIIIFIGIIAISSFLWLFFINTPTSSEDDTKRVSDLSSIQQTLDYWLDNHASYPTSLNDLSAPDTYPSTHKLYSYTLGTTGVTYTLCATLSTRKQHCVSQDTDSSAWHVATSSPYINSQYGYSIQFPQGWIYSTRIMPGARPPGLPTSTNGIYILIAPTSSTTPESSKVTESTLKDGNEYLNRVVVRGKNEFWVSANLPANEMDMYRQQATDSLNSFTFIASSTNQSHIYLCLI